MNLRANKVVVIPVVSKAARRLRWTKEMDETVYEKIVEVYELLNAIDENEMEEREEIWKKIDPNLAIAANFEQWEMLHPDIWNIAIKRLAKVPSFPSLTVKQIKDRFNNHLRVDKSEWTVGEDKLLHDGCRAHGRKW